MRRRIGENRESKTTDRISVQFTLEKGLFALPLGTVGDFGPNCAVDVVMLHRYGTSRYLRASLFIQKRAFPT
jgi:hypothetical protein